MFEIMMVNCICDHIRLKAFDSQVCLISRASFVVTR